MYITEVDWYGSSAWHDSDGLWTPQPEENWGHRLEYAGYDQPADEVWPNMPDVLQAAEVFFGLSDGGKALFADGSPTLYTFWFAAPPSNNWRVRESWQEKGYEMLWIFWIKSIWISFQVSDEWGSSRSTFCQHWTTLDPVFLLFISPSFFHLLFSCYFLHSFLPSFLSFLLSLLVLVLSFLHPFLSSFLPFLFIFLLLPLETLAFFGSASKQDT